MRQHITPTNKRSLILYGHPEQLTNGHTNVFPGYFVRCEIVNTNIEDALSCAKPMAGEVVLNTVKYPET